MSDRDDELVRYAINAAEIKQQDDAWDAFNRITAERDRLAQRVAELEVDAARYRKLRESFSDAVLCYDSPGLDDSGWFPICGEDLDHAVDAIDAAKGEA